MGIYFKTDVVQATGMKMFYRVPNNNKMKPILRCVYVDTLDVKEAIDTVMEELHNTKEIFIKPILALIQGGKP
jgi:hypothetical protein